MKRLTKKVLDRLAELEIQNAPSKPSRKKPKLRWYAVQVTPQQEKAVRRTILRESKILFLNDRVGRIIIPKNKVVELRKSQRVLMRRRRYPGYLICHLALDAQVRRLVNSCPGSLGFLPDRYSPAPLTDDEVALVMLQEKQNSKKSTVTFDTGLAPGDLVEIKEGAFAGQQVRVKKVTNERTHDPIILVHATLWGRPAPVELHVNQFKRINEEV